jgi:tetratricopeptide (TPR) repeat protein
LGNAGVRWFVHTLMSSTSLDGRREPSILQFVLVGVGVAVGLCAFLLALAAALGGAGLFFGALALTVVIVWALKRNRKRGRPAVSPVRIEDLRLNPFPLYARVWRTPVNLGGAGAIAIILTVFGVILVIVGWPLWAVVLAVIATAALSLIGTLALYFAGFFMMVMFTRLAGGDLAVAAQLGKKGRHEESLGFCRRYTNRHPNDPAGWTASCMALWHLGRLEDALVDADRAVRLGAGDQAKMLRGILFCTTGLHEEACGDLTANENRKETLVYLGHSLTVLRRLDDAIIALREAGALTDRADEFVQLGEAYRLRGIVEGASIAYAKALELAVAGRTISETSEAIRAYCLVRLGRIDAAEQIAEAVLADRPAEALALHAVALVYNLRGDADDTYGSIERMVATPPDGGVWAFRDRDFTPLLGESRFRELLAWALGAQRQKQARIRKRLNASGD